jgi:hypothetical protein
MMNQVLLTWRCFAVFLYILLMSGYAIHLPVDANQSRLSLERQQHSINQMKEVMNKGNITGLSLVMIDKEGLRLLRDFGAPKAQVDPPLHLPS